MKRPIMQKNSIYRKIILPLLTVLLLEAILLVGVPILSGMLDDLCNNAEAILGQQVENRKDYLETMMLNDWSDLNRLTAIINEKTQELLDEGTITLDELQRSSSVCNTLLQNISEELIAELYAKRVNGIYVMFNTRDLEPLREAREMPNCTGLYVCDLDPNSTPAKRNRDLLLVRAPIGFVQSVDMSTSSNWRPMYTFSPEEAVENYDFLYQPFQEAYKAENIEKASDYGYWSAANSTWLDSRDYALTYSVPLVLDDGTVYGVLGIELFNSYIASLLPYEELSLNSEGAYVLAQISKGIMGADLRNVMLINGDRLQKADLTDLQLRPAYDAKNCYLGTVDGKEYYFNCADISLYNQNTPFDEQRWVLLGILETSVLYATANRTGYVFGLSLLLMATIGIGGSIFVGRRLSQPIRRLSEEVQQSREENNGIPQLSRTEIEEIDNFAMAITDLSRDLINASSRVMHIIDMASVEIAVFEVRENEMVFVTENFFPLFDIEVEDVETLTTHEFVQLLNEIRKNHLYTKRSDDSLIYEIETESGEIRYVRLNINQSEESVTGLAEDITQSVLEKKRIEYERDYDLLTGLTNRRAFYREANKLFNVPKKLGIAAVIMLDVDNLKTINDHYGHELGDQYIYQLTHGFKEAMPRENVIMSRLSGDEFVALLYGYDNKDSILEIVDAFSKTTKQNVFNFPDGKNMLMDYSAGMAFYPDDSDNLSDLLKYADFAMYQIKKNAKGRVGQFDINHYQEASRVQQSRYELMKLLEEGNLQYYFQPIFSAKDGSVFAYEALMRVNMPTLHSPDSVLKLAKQENRLHDVERLSMFKSVEHYQSLLASEEVRQEAYLFINSLADEYLTQEEQDEFGVFSAELSSQIVIEVTEGNEIAEEALYIKQNMTCYSGLLALDDYGSGYNSEKNLLELAPKFVKVDMSIIRDIDSNVDKQLIVANLVQYAHQRDMMIIAEGIETPAELYKVLELGVDLLQGYVLARPAAKPPEISESAKEMILNFK